MVSTLGIKGSSMSRYGKWVGRFGLGGWKPLSGEVWKLSAQGIPARDGAQSSAFSLSPEIARLSPLPQPNLPREKQLEFLLCRLKDLPRASG